MQDAGVHVDSLFLLQLRRNKCNQVQKAAKPDRPFNVSLG